MCPISQYDAWDELFTDFENMGASKITAMMVCSGQWAFHNLTRSMDACFAQHSLGGGTGAHCDEFIHAKRRY